MHEIKMSSGARKNMFQMSAVQLEPLLNAAGKVFDNADIFLLDDRRDDWWGTRCSTIFTSDVSFKVLDQL